MAANLIATASTSTIHSLAHQGILVYQSVHQIRDLVRARLGEEYALLFAEPSLSKDGGAIDWYTPVQGTARRLVDLPEEEQRAARAATIRMAQDIARVAVELKQSGIAPQVTRGTILELALQYPDDKCLYLVGEQPVFTCWGFGPGTPGAQPQDLTRLGEAATPPDIPTPQTRRTADDGTPDPAPASQTLPSTQSVTMPKARSGFSWLWLLPLLLLVPLLFLLTASFGGKAPLIPIPGFSLKMPGLPSIPLPDFNFKLPDLPFLKMTPDSPAEAEKEPAAEAERLRAELRDLESKLRSRAAECPQESVPEQERKALVIPEKPSDMDFLRGRWLCDRGLVNKADKQPLVLLYDFDSSGKGTARVRQKGREDCVGPAAASMNAQGGLVIKVDEQICPNGRNYAAETIECRGGAANNEAMCRGKTDQGADWGESVPFYKIDSGEFKTQTTPQAGAGASLRIPPGAAKSGDLSFLEGCWRGTRPEYHSKRIITERFCFDKNGSGKRTIDGPEDMGKKCIGDAKGSFDEQGRLIVTSEQASCTTGHRWSQAHMVCQGEGASTPCFWRFPDAGGASQTYKIPLVRE